MLTAAALIGTATYGRVNQTGRLKSYPPRRRWTAAAIVRVSELPAPGVQW